MACSYRAWQRDLLRVQLSLVAAAEPLEPPEKRRDRRRGALGRHRRRLQSGSSRTGGFLTAGEELLPDLRRETVSARLHASRIAAEEGQAPRPGAEVPPLGR